ncbi:tetratricopeptide repeat protein [Aphanothece sacrum]|uniref:TPR repeat-containing protein n=1 Tax=Aphanothece sacrum FPU1 TaxID=1920663 RepID=A0A401IL58_APHSA|nr:tetratricopeptide repeat protein [Aphanothece sacrum]GBF81989.1 TPR repeat-containing protein [Aphanothece sacrum FPU1]GBF83619.1 TPR repeat-containing protein [Aphanothece sacrum FPU3]
MKSSDIDQLLNNLQQADEFARHRATSQLWQIWFEQKGEFGLELLKRSQFFLESGDTQKAEEMLTETIKNYPDFAEAWNRRAMLYFTQEKYQNSKQDCERVVQLIPYHFGAWHGLGLCLLALGQYSEAIQAFRQALEIQPYALVNQKLILECTALLN